jgi:cytoskeletal protein RodZ
MNDAILFYNELKTKRESQNLTLEEISEFTKIDIKFLIAIEEGDFLCLPSVYMRLFLRSYCEYISADTEQALNDYEFHTLGTKTETKSFISSSKAKQSQNSEASEKELNLPQVPTIKIITVVITVIALLLTFFFISSINNNLDSPNDIDEDGDPNDIVEEIYLKENIPTYVEIPNQELLTNEVFQVKNIDRSGEVNLASDAPFNLRVEALTDTKITVTNVTNGKKEVTRKILIAGDVEIFEVEKEVSFDFWSGEHIKCSLNDINLTQYFTSEHKLIRGWFSAVDRKLSYRLFNYPPNS